MVAKLKSIGFWLSVVLTLIGLAASNGLLGSGAALQVAGWITTVLTVLGVHMLNPPAAPVAAPAAAPKA